MTTKKAIKIKKMLNTILPKSCGLVLKVLPTLYMLSNGYNYQIGIYKNNTLLDTFFILVDDIERLIK